MDGYETETIGDRLRRMRTEKGFSQRAISGPGVTAAYVSRIERGERHPSVRTIRVMARKLGVSPEYLETGTELPDAEARDLRLTEAELQLRLGEDLKAVARAFSALVKEAEKVGDEVALMRAQIGLGLVAEHEGRHKEAIDLLEPALQAPFVTPRSHPQEYIALGHAYVVVEQGEKAVALFRSCLEQLSRDPSGPSDRNAYVRFATYLSFALSDLGDLAGARAAIADAVAKTDEHMDPYTRVRVYWSQARLAATEGEFGLAKRNMGRAIALLETTEDDLHLGRAHLLNAEILLTSGENGRAGAELERAQALLGKRSDAQERAWLLVERGRFEARTGDPAQAIADAEEAIALLGDEDEALRGRALWTRAEALAARGDIDNALKTLDEAEGPLQGEARYAPEILRARANLLEQAGRLGDALAVLKKVTEIGR
jgi:tetratricopeptide (TPR) repeat protein